MPRPLHHRALLPALILPLMIYAQGGVGGAAAPPADDDAAAPAARPAGHTRPRLVFHAPRGTDSQAAAAFALQAALKATRQIRFVDLAAVIEAPELAEQGEQLRQAGKLLARGAKLVADGKARQAMELMDRAVRNIEFNFPALLRRAHGLKPLLVAMRYLARATMSAKGRRATRPLVRRMLALDPKTVPDPDRDSRRLRKLITAEIKNLASSAMGVVVAKSDPPGAELLLDAQSLGRGAMRKTGVIPGRHYITARLVGYRSTTVAVDVTAGGTHTETIRMERHEAPDPALQLQGALGEIGRERIGPNTAGLARRAKASVVVLARLRGSATSVTASLYLYDARSGRLVKAVSRSLRDEHQSKDARAIVEKVLAPLVPSVRRHIPRLRTRVGPRRRTKSVRPIGPTRPRGETWRRFRNWRGFWPVIGSVAGAAVVGLVIGLAVGLQTPGVRGGRHVILAHPLTRF